MTHPVREQVARIVGDQDKADAAIRAVLEAMEQHCALANAGLMQYGGELAVMMSKARAYEASIAGEMFLIRWRRELGL